jgi:NAD(P)-dependent dehydrogenase (short-subunit alcohol dehydrogenase family)
MGTYVVTCSTSGIGAATSERLVGQGHRVVGVDRADADVNADLGDAGQRRRAVAEVTALTDAVADGVVCCAGIPGSTGRDGADLVSVNYFGTVDLLLGLRPVLAAAEAPAAVCLSSNSVTCQAGWPGEVAQACLDGDETQARKRAGLTGAVHVYPATKAALAWWTRREAVGEEWIGAGIRLNAVAPGFVETGMTAEMRRDPELGELVDAYPQPVGRPGRPDEIAATIGFLLGREASLCCGTVLYVDGGTDALFNPQRPAPPD